MATSPQRAYKAACPSCGAPVEFRSAASASAVCSFCRSTLLRDGEALRRIGVTAELFDDHSPLQLGASGRYQGETFTVVGRLQYGYEAGTWNEWHALFDNGRSGWLSEDNGAYVFAFDAPLAEPAPPAATLAAGQRQRVEGRAWDIASVTTARLIAAQGELPFAPPLAGSFIVADFRNAQGEVGTLDYGDAAQVHWSVGRGVALGELALTGLRQTSEKALGARKIECPNCGAPVEVKLANTQSVSCSQCKSVIDLAAGAGGELHHYAQNNSGHDGAEPTLPLGSTAVLTLGSEGARPWTVVGMVERCDIPADAEEDTTFWREYLIYNQVSGFAFLVDAEDGWSWVRPITGAPQSQQRGVSWQGVRYDWRYEYEAKVTWVQGEFYWRVRRDERATVTEFHGAGNAHRKRLAREKVGNEVTWSAGELLDAAVLAKAFGVPIAAAPAAVRPDAAVLSSALATSARSVRFVVFAFIALIVLLAILDSCSDECDVYRDTYGAASAEYQQCKRSGGTGFRSGGGSYGGSSSGGWHK